jgi:hypothetical protein
VKPLTSAGSHDSTLILIWDEFSRELRGAAIVPSDRAKDCVEHILARVGYAAPSKTPETLIADGALGRFVARITRTMAVRIRRAP